MRLRLIDRISFAVPIVIAIACAQAVRWRTYLSKGHLFSILTVLSFYMYFINYFHRAFPLELAEVTSEMLAHPIVAAGVVAFVLLSVLQLGTGLVMAAITKQMLASTDA